MNIRIPGARAWYFLVAIVSLLCAAVIYPLFRGPDLLIWNIVPQPGFWEMWQRPYPTKGIASVLVGSGTDFLWMLSGICLLRGLWYRERNKQKLYLALLYLIAAGYNIGQYFGALPGTFDVLDLLTMSGVALAEAIFWTFCVRRKQNEQY